MNEAPASRPAPAAVDTAIGEVEQQFSLLFARVRSDMRDRAARFHPELGVLGYSIVAVLSHAESLRPGEIARELNLDKSTLSRQSAELLRLGLVEREPDPDDHRSVRLRLSPAAAARMLEERGRQRTATYAALRSWDLGELRELARLLGRLNDLATARD
jgi:DNA-binding MarR family transcriptional regulator